MVERPSVYVCLVQEGYSLFLMLWGIWQHSLHSVCVCTRFQRIDLSIIGLRHLVVTEL